MSSTPEPQKCGMLTSSGELRDEQTATVRRARFVEDPVERQRAIDDAREVRQHERLKSAVWWGVLGIPAAMQIFAMAVGYLVREVGSSSSSSFP